MRITTVPSDVVEIGRVIVDPARAYALIDQLMSAYNFRRDLYQHIHRVDAPQTVCRPSELVIGSQEHARWLFFAAMTDRREVSSQVYAAHRELWRNYADVLYNNPLDLLMDEESVVTLLREHKFGMPSTAAASWVACSKTLFFQLEGDPTRIYDGTSIDGIVSKKKREWKLPGFGSKILSLLAIFYAELEMIEMPVDAFPVDVHVQRFALSTGILSLKQEERNSTLERILRPLLSRICQERGWAPVEVAHAIWFLGNQLCTVCSFGTQSRMYCPVYQDCGGAFTSLDYFKRGMWNPQSRYPKGNCRPFGWPVTEGLLPFPTT